MKDGDDYVIGDIVEWQTSNGDWVRDMKIVGFFERSGGLSRLVNLEDPMGNVTRGCGASMGRIRKQLASREIDGVTFTVGDKVQYLTGGVRDASVWQWGYTITNVGSGTSIGITNSRGQYFACHFRRLRRDQTATIAGYREEAHYRAECAKAWQARCKYLDLKLNSVGRAKQLEAFLQAYVAMATCTEMMTMARASQIQFLVAVGRGEEYLSGVTGSAK